MPKKARTYILFVSALGLIALGSVFWAAALPRDVLRFGMYFLLAQIAAALKLRLPGLTGTMSIGFVFVLLGISELTLLETMLMACCGVLVQCFWRAKQRPTAAQVIFSVAAVAISVMLAFECADLVRETWHTDSVPILMALATCVYFASNSLLVSGVLSRIQGKSLRGIWEQCYLLSLPYYVIGGTVAGLMAAASREVGWQLPLLILPSMALAFLFFRMWFGRMTVAA